MKGGGALSAKGALGALREGRMKIHGHKGSIDETAVRRVMKSLPRGYPGPARGYIEPRHIDRVVFTKAVGQDLDEKGVEWRICSIWYHMLTG